ncbi:MAG: DNA starvation/stationary phase protection protein [Chloroflexi bacterium HGW-Chloroflexi-4]|jgi:starvation-inducible DNA-binding protein|nr:MAG: DNA starvation/stationary phase protection protein [Chloroflexi bacterium HGW-Chloroflexi-4]
MGLIQNNGHDPKLPIVIQPNIGLENDVRLPIIKILNSILSNEAVLSLKTRNAHWNVKGTNFFELHFLFDTQYKQLNDISDEIAERVRMVGGSAMGSFAEFLTHSRLEEHPPEIPNTLQLLADHETIIRYLHEDIRKCNDEYEDEGSSDLMVSVMRMHEKMAWMLRSYIETEPVVG